VVQELLKLFNLEEIDVLSSSSEQSEQLFLALFDEAATGNEGPRTMRLKGCIHGREALILVDSGNTNTFLSKQFAAGLQGCNPCQIG
jgi:hypothetical protein